MGGMITTVIPVRWAVYAPDSFGSDLQLLGHVVQEKAGYYAEAPYGASTDTLASQEDAVEALKQIALEEGTLG